MDIVKLVLNVLKEKETVVIPALGRFTLTTVSAKIHPVDHVFTPPFKIILFESIASQNDLLAQYIAEQEQITVDQATNEISAFTENVLKGIQNEKHFKVEGFGIFELNNEKLIVFTADSSLFADEFIGFNEFTSPAIVRTEFKDKAVQLAQQEKEKQAKRRKKRKLFIIISFLLIIIAALVYLFLFSDITSNFLNKNEIKTNPTPVADTAKKQIINDTINLHAKDSLNNIISADTNHLQNKTQETGDYFIVAASFKSEENANKSVEKLKTKGFNGAGITHQQGNSMFIVYYQSYASKDDALKALQQIIKNENPESWLLKK
ncbi:MAG: SPOR domain-containing protein [Bacteroidetes bacterium]|nr:SPOR domain-containing protein [Bacteroidota bacterium]